MAPYSGEWCGIAGSCLVVRMVRGVEGMVLVNACGVTCMGVALDFQKWV